jgi:hypothetical protein
MASHPTEPDWVALLCETALLFRESDQSMVELFVSANPKTTDRGEFLSEVTRYIRHHPELISVWIGYSASRLARVHRGVYFKVDAQPEVGVYSSSRHHDESGPYSEVRHYEDPAEACADFLWREVNSIQENPCWPMT